MSEKDKLIKTIRYILIILAVLVVLPFALYFIAMFLYLLLMVVF